MRAVCTPEIIYETPGLSHVVSHDIVLKEDTSVRLMSYRILERLLVSLKEELDQMLCLWITEQSKSEWCHPVVLVPKKMAQSGFVLTSIT